MNYLIRNAKVYDLTGPWHLKTVDIRVSQGIVSEIAESLTAHASDIEISSLNLCVSQVCWTYRLLVQVLEPNTERI